LKHDELPSFQTQSKLAELLMLIELKDLYVLLK